MKLLGRVLQFLAVALVAHAATMHMFMLRLHTGPNAGPKIAESWMHFSIAAGISVLLFVGGLLLERRR